MRCRKVLSQIHAYWDGEIPEGRKQDLEAHLSVCPSCRAKLEGLATIEKALDGVEAPPPPHGFAVRVRAEALRRRAVSELPEEPLFPTGLNVPEWLRGLSLPMRAAAFGAILLACLSGAFLGREFALGRTGPPSSANAVNVEGLEWFSPAPPSSVGSAYLTMASASNESRGTK